MCCFRCVLYISIIFLFFIMLIRPPQTNGAVVGLSATGGRLWLGSCFLYFRCRIQLKRVSCIMQALLILLYWVVVITKQNKNVFQNRRMNVWKKKYMLLPVQIIHLATEIYIFKKKTNVTAAGLSLFLPLTYFAPCQAGMLYITYHAINMYTSPSLPHCYTLPFV